MRILLQYPEGLKREAFSYSDKLNEEGHEVFLSGSACYGACDLALEEAQKIKADKIIHFGHSRFIRSKLPIAVEYKEYSIDINLELFKKSLNNLKKYRKIALGTTVQYIHQIKEMKRILEEQGFSVLVGKGTRAEYCGQILGCDASALMFPADEADAVLVVSDGIFHSLAYNKDLPVFQLQPKTGDIRNLSGEIRKLGKRRRGAVIAASQCYSFGILLSTKPGQLNTKGALKAKEFLVEKGKRADIIVSNEFNPDSLSNFTGFEAYVNTACPRIADDSQRFGKPIVNIDDLEEMLVLMNNDDNILNI